MTCNRHRRRGQELRLASCELVFEGASYRYLRMGDFVYWTSRSLWNRSQRNINRRPAADVEGQPEHEQASLPV